MEIQLALAAVHLTTALKYRRGWNKDNVGVQILKGFTKGKGLKASQQYRLYLPIHAKHPKVKIPPAIKSAVESAGYVISDYIAGLATQKDGKRVMKIGKLLKTDSLRNTFANDTQRQSHKNEYTCVISCHPYDIIGMSTGRTWDQFSCMRLGAGSKLNADSNNGTDGAYAETVARDVQAGTLVAYAVKNSDTNINSPDARLLIKPFKSATGKEILFRVETKVYGNHVTGFRETVSAFLREVNKNVSAGRYTLIDGLYNDGAGYGALHLGPLAYADLTDPEGAKEWIAAANIGHISDKFKEGNQKEILTILQQGSGDNLYKEYIFNEVSTDLFEGEVDVDDAGERLDIILPKLIDLGKAGRPMIDVMMNKYFAKFTVHALPEISRGLIRQMVWYDSERNYSFPFKTWAYRLNPAVLMQPNGDVDKDIEPYLNNRTDYPFIESIVLKAPKYSKLYPIALMESFFKFATAKMKGLKSTNGWRAVAPDDFDNAAFIRAVSDRMDEYKWTDAQKLYAWAANSKDYFNATYSSDIGLPYLEQLKIADLFNNPYVAQLYQDGLPDTSNDASIADNWASIFERVCRTDKEGVKAEETRLYEVAELLGEHDYNIKRGIEREIERALYD